MLRRFHHVDSFNRLLTSGGSSLDGMRDLPLGEVSGETESESDIIEHSDLETQNDPGSSRPLGGQSVECEALTATSS